MHARKRNSIEMTVAKSSHEDIILYISYLRYPMMEHDHCDVTIFLIVYGNVYSFSKYSYVLSY